MHDELGAMTDRLREEAGRLSAELRTLERDVVELGPPPAEEPELAPPPEEEPEPELELVEEPVEEEPEPKASDNEEDARLVALDMALAGTAREETERYLAEHYTLADPGAILDDVYALAGS
jgi:hypothetical protein